MGIDAKLTVVVQGPIEWSVSSRSHRPITQSLCESIRRLLPKATIVVSTWEKDNVDGLKFDTLVRSKDPGSQGVIPSFTPNNINRQIVSTTAGLRAVETPYCLKIRSDFELFGAEFLEALPDLPKVNGPNAIFERQVLTNNLSSRNSRAIMIRHPDHPLLFHPSDHMHAGLTKDILTLWDIPLQSDEDAVWFLTRSRPNVLRDNELSRLAPEQHLFVSAIEKRRPVGLKDYAHFSPQLLALSEEMLSSHFLHIPDRQLPIFFQKYHTDHHFSFDWMRIGSAMLGEKLPLKVRMRLELRRRIMAWTK